MCDLEILVIWLYSKHIFKEFPSEQRNIARLQDLTHVLYQIRSKMPMCTEITNRQCPK